MAADPGPELVDGEANPSVRRSSKRHGKSAAGAENLAAADKPHRTATWDAYKTQLASLQMLIARDGAWVFELDVEGRGDCWAFASLACTRLTSLHIL